MALDDDDDEAMTLKVMSITTIINDSEKCFSVIFLNNGRKRKNNECGITGQRSKER